MARRRSTREFAVEHEDFIAKRYSGTRSPSSGASTMDDFDVESPDTLFECKATGHTKPAKSISLKLETVEGIADAAWAAGKEPAIPLRIYNPDSPLADHRGYIDLICRLVEDDSHRG